MEMQNKKRLATKGIAVLIVQQSVKYYRSFLPLLILVGFRDSSRLLLFGILGLVLIVGLALWQYWFTTYYIDTRNQEFVLSKGGFSRDETRIPLEKIESINLSQPPTQQLLNLTKLQINSLGSKKSEVDLLALSTQTASTLQAFLQKHVEAKSSDQLENEEFTKLETQTKRAWLSVSLKKLALHGFLAPNFRFVFTALGAGYFLIDDILSFLGFEDSVVEILRTRSVMVPTYFFVLIALFVYAANTIGQILTYWMQTLLIEDGFWRLSYGLIKKEARTLGVSKIQILKTIQNPLQKRYRQFSLKILSPESKTSIKIAVLDPKQKAELIAIWENAFQSKGIQLVANWRYVLPYFWVALPLTGVAIFSEIYLLFIPALYFIIYAWVSFRFHKLIPTNNGLILENGFWNQTQTFIPIKKIQSIRVTQALWHMRKDVGYIVVNTAVGSFRFGPGSKNELKTLMEESIHALEKSNASWA